MRHDELEILYGFFDLVAQTGLVSIRSPLDLMGRTTGNVLEVSGTLRFSSWKTRE
jgi:hypothetical protein